MQGKCNTSKTRTGFKTMTAQSLLPIAQMLLLDKSCTNLSAYRRTGALFSGAAKALRQCCWPAAPDEGSGQGFVCRVQVTISHVSGLGRLWTVGIVCLKTQSRTCHAVEKRYICTKSLTNQFQNLRVASVRDKTRVYWGSYILEALYL